jgi:hypothetical protein
MYHPDDIDQAIHARQQRYRHEAYFDRLPTRSLRRVLGMRLIRLGTALGGAHVPRSQS